ncbi:glycosyltransferase [Shewanella frigidimarina]|uniref:glycosyltransferase n=1 Tax=Shewanella frigidimarina TaxID=56812 RepID=UPI003F9EF446
MSDVSNILKTGDEMLVSVVMSVYNSQDYLRESIESVLNQSYENFEFIIINDGSTDLSESIIFEYDDSRIVYSSNIKNKGLIYSLNKGVSLAKGKYIARFDSDDICMKYRLECQLNFLVNNCEYNVVGSTAEIINSNGEFQGHFRLPETDVEIKTAMIFSNQIIHPAAMIRMESLNSLSCYYDLNYKHAEDYKLWLDLSSCGKFYNIQKPLIKYRVHGDNISIKHSGQQETLSKILSHEFCIINSIKFDVEAYKNILYKRIIEQSDVEVFYEIFDNDSFIKQSYLAKIYFVGLINLKKRGGRIIKPFFKSRFKKRINHIVIVLLYPLLCCLPKFVIKKYFRVLLE